MDEVTLNTATIDRLVLAYNASGALGLPDLFLPDAVHGDINSPDGQRGRRAIHARYVETFGAYPRNRTEVAHRIAHGVFVIDHARVRRSPDVAPCDVVAAYTMRGGLIARLDFVRT